MHTPNKLPCLGALQESSTKPRQYTTEASISTNGSAVGAGRQEQQGPSKLLKTTVGPSSSTHGAGAGPPMAQEPSKRRPGQTTETSTSAHGAGASHPAGQEFHQRLNPTEPSIATHGAAVRPPEDHDESSTLSAKRAAETSIPTHGAALCVSRVEAAPSKRARLAISTHVVTASIPPEEALAAEAYMLSTHRADARPQAQEEEEEVGELSAMTNPVVLRSLAQFVPATQFLFFAPVCQRWRAAWGERPALTSHVSPDSTLSQLRYSLECGLPRGHSVDLCTALARLGKLDLVRYSNARGYHYHWNSRTTETLARAGDLKLLKMVVRNGCEWSEKTTAAAARGGHVTLLRWALSHGCPFDATLCAAAARGGHLSLLRGARQRNFPWDTRTTMGAAAGGHIQVLKWARKNGCRWKLGKCCRHADKHGHGHVKEWIQKVRRWCASGSSQMLMMSEKRRAG